jgi:hypothetical protein
MPSTDYEAFLDAKTHSKNDHGFDPVWIPDKLFDFQRALLEWATRKGRSAIFADCGLGKTFMQLAWAENVARKTGGRVLILTPLAVSFQTVSEGEKIGVEVAHRREGMKDGDRIVVTNYERLHYFNPSDFVGVVCDESSILKNYAGATRQEITDFMEPLPYRLLCTATAAPNDYMELGTSSEALGIMRRPEMLGMFFTHDGGETSKWRIKGHAERRFWEWVCLWARAMRRPSDLGFDDSGFSLPPLQTREHVVESRTATPGALFSMVAMDLDEQREELRRTMPERCEMAAQLVATHNGPSISWCHLNEEGRMLRQMIPGAVEVSGSDTEERKESVFEDFSKGNIQNIVTKPKIAGFGMNWQHCAHQTFFPSHSYEQYYQCVRRSWRYGQTNPVTVDIISTDGQQAVLSNLKRKAESCSAMFDSIVSLMREDSMAINEACNNNKKVEVPSWL